MTYALKVLFKEAYRLLKSKEGRLFLNLCRKLGNKPRNNPMKVRVTDRWFQIADTWSFLWQYHEIFYRKSYAFTPDTENPLIIDCGSNIGLSIIYFKQLLPKSTIIGFEPDPRIFAMLEQNVSGLPDIEIYQKAVWKDNNGVHFEKGESDTGHISPDSGTFIESISLKELLLSYNRVDLLKMDVEGAEFTVLKDCGDALAKVERLFVEIHTYVNEDQNISELLRILEKAGFRYFVENENDQVSPLHGNWKTGTNGMDVQINVFAVRMK